MPWRNVPHVCAMQKMPRFFAWKTMASGVSLRTVTFRLRSEHTPYNRESPAGRAMIEQQIVHIPDLAAVVDSEFPVGQERTRMLSDIERR